MKKFSIWLKENKSWSEEIATVAQQHTSPMDKQNAFAPTITQAPNQQYQRQQYHDHPVVDKLIDIVKNKIDHLTWDYGKDAVETAIAGALDSVPHMKSQCDHIAGCWKKFKDALYKELGESTQPWWGGPNKAPNPVKYDVALLNIRDMEKIFEEMKDLCSKCDKADLNQLFFQFLEEYGKVMPGLKAQIETFKKNTARR